MKFANQLAAGVDRLTVTASLTVFAQSTYTNIEVVNLRESSSVAPFLEATIRIPAVPENFVEETSLLNQAYRFGQTVTPQPNTLTLTQTVDGQTHTRRFTVYIASATVTTNNEGRSAEVNLVSADGLMTLMFPLNEGQSSEQVIFDHTREIDEEWNQYYSLDVRTAVDYHPFRAQTGLDWTHDDAPDNLTRLVIDDSFTGTFYEIASSIAQLFGHYVRQHETNALAWTTSPFVRFDRPTLNLGRLPLISDERSTNTETCGDVIEFYWHNTIMNEYGREVVERSRRIGRRATVLGKVSRVQIQPRASTNTALLNQARNHFLTQVENRRVTTLLDITAEVGTRVSLGGDYFYVSDISHDLDAATTTLELRTHYTLAASTGRIWADLPATWRQTTGQWRNL